MSFKALNNRKGQSQIVEYSIIFFLVVAVVVGMSTYVKRAMQARIRGARNYMWVQVNGTFNQYHAGAALPVEYEPYYVKTTSTREENTTDREIHRALAGGEGTYISNITSVIDSTSTSIVAPAINGD